MGRRGTIGKPDRGGCSSGKRSGGGHTLAFGTRAFFVGGAGLPSSLGGATAASGADVVVDGRENFFADLDLRGGGGERLDDGERSRFAVIDPFNRRGGILASPGRSETMDGGVPVRRVRQKMCVMVGREV